MAMVEDVGLPAIGDETDESANEFMADAPKTTIILWDDAGEHRFGVYALGFQDDPPR